MAEVTKWFSTEQLHFVVLAVLLALALTLDVKTGQYGTYVDMLFAAVLTAAGTRMNAPKSTKP